MKPYRSLAARNIPGSAYSTVYRVSASPDCNPNSDPLLLVAGYFLGEASGHLRQ